MIKSIVFFYNGRRGTTELTVAGVKKTDSDNSSDGNLIATELQINYNRGIRSYQAIQNYICNNIDIYPEFKGSTKAFSGRI